MFYSQFILAKKGPLGTIWIAAHLERKLRKNQVADTDIGVSVDSILFPEVPIALRLSSHLLLGVVRIYSRKVNYLFDDCSEALLKIKQAFRSTAVDLPPEESTAPYHSITLPETFDLDDFELPDNDIFQGNYVDHHISTREQITLQDTMDGVVYSTSQFGLDERFGDGDASQIGLDLDEELLLNKETADVHGVSDADPQGSVKPMTPWDQDDTNEQINDTLEAMAGNGSANQLERFRMNAEFVEYAEAPSTPGLVEQPNLSNVQEALVSDDHLELEDHNSNELVAAESSKSALSKSDLLHGDNSTIDSNHDNVQCKLPEENGYHGDSIKPTSLVSDCSEGILGAPEGSEIMQSIHNVRMPSVESHGVKLDETAVSPSCSQVASDIGDPNRKTDPGSTNVPVSEGFLVDDQASVKAKIYNDAQIVDNEGESGSGAPVNDGLACKEHEDSECLSNKVVLKEMASSDTNGLKPCSSHLGQPDGLSPGHENSATPNFQPEEVEPCSFETSKRNGASIEVQGEECQVTDTTQSEGNQISGPALCGEIHTVSSKLDGPLDNANSGDNRLQNLNDTMSSELPAPEKLLSVPEGFLDKPNDLLVESTPAREVLDESGGVGAGNKPTSGKKRSYTESTLTMESLNSSESFGVTRAKRTSESIPDDDDLLSSILVGRRSSVLKMKPTPPAPEVASRKRTRSAPQTSALKRKVLMDDTMVLHGDIIRQQLTSTEDIRRIRKKAPCTCSEILMIQLQFLEDEIFSEPTLTGMSAELMSLHYEPHDMSRIRISENETDVQKDEGSARPNVSEGGMEESSEAVVLRNDVEARPADTTIQIESEQGGDCQLGSLDLDSQGHNAVADMEDLKTMEREPLVEITEMDIDRENTDVANAANCSTAHDMPTDEKTDAADVSQQIDASCLTPEQKVDAQPVEEDASVLDVINSKGVDATQDADQNTNGIVAVETEMKDGDELPPEEGEVGVFVENRVDASTKNVNTLEPASLEDDDIRNNLASGIDDPSKLGVVNEDGTLVADLGCDGKDSVTNHMTGEEPIVDLVENGADLKNAGLETGENSIFQEVDLQSAMDLEIVAFDHLAVEDHGELEGFGMGNDTEFLNVDDDEVAEDYDDGMERTEDARLLENSGWSSRTRAVAKYLQTLFDRETTNGRKVLAMDHLLAGKTRKEASRMFFETLVLKSKDYIHVEQARSLDNINIKPRAKLMKSEF